MAMVEIARSREENKDNYTSQYLKWKGYVDTIPILDSIIQATGAAVSSSWRIYGKNAKKMTGIVNEFSGNGKQTFKQLMNNAVMVSMIGGDCYFEIVADKDLNVENIVILPPDNIRQVLKNGKIKSYEEIDGKTEWKPAEILHFSYSQVGAMTHGRSVVEPMNNVLTDYLQMLDTGQKIYEHYVKPREIYYADTDDQATLDALKDTIRKVNATPKDALVLPKGTLEVTFQGIEGKALSPREWVRVLMDNIIMSARVPELALGTGTVNSEESAKVQFEGFRQLVRWIQQWMEETIELQLFRLQYPENTPKIEFSFAAEPEEERFNRMLNAFSQLNAWNVPDELGQVKILSMLRVLQEAGIVPEEI